MTFKFNLRQKVKINKSGLFGLVISRTEHIDGTNSYVCSQVNKDGHERHICLAESDLTNAED